MVEQVLKMDEALKDPNLKCYTELIKLSLCSSQRMRDDKWGESHNSSISIF